MLPVWGDVRVTSLRGWSSLGVDRILAGRVPDVYQFMMMCGVVCMFRMVLMKGGLLRLNGCYDSWAIHLAGRVATKTGLSSGDGVVRTCLATCRHWRISGEEVRVNL